MGRKMSKLLNRIKSLVLLIALATTLPLGIFFSIPASPALAAIVDNVTAINGAAVFNDFIDPGDLLIVLDITNTRLPYYSTKTDSTLVYDIQLLGTDNATELAANALRAWERTPQGIYLSPDQAASINPSGAYIIRMISKMGTSNNTTYTLQSSDWLGEDLRRLDNWCINMAQRRVTYYGGTSSDYIVYSGSGGVMNARLSESEGIIFNIGIPGLSDIRPDLFSVASKTYGLTTTTQTNLFNTGSDWQTMVGTDITNDMNAAGDWSGVTGKSALSIVFGAIFLLVFMAIVNAGLPPVIGTALLALPVLFAGMYVGVIDATVMFAIAFIGVFYFLYIHAVGKS